MNAKKFLSLALSLAMTLSLTLPAAAAGAAPTEDVVILYTNDIHTYIDNTRELEDGTEAAGLRYSTVAALKDGYENVLLVDAGDHIQGTAYGSMDKGKTILELMNASGYDLATLGNHEFDYGMDGAMNAMDWANFPYVSANFYHEAGGVAGETVLDAYKVFEVGGVKIAFVGITTPESFTKSTPAYFQNEAGEYIYGIAGGTDGAALYDAVQAAIDAASAQADIVIGLGHLGDDPASRPWTSEEVIANTCGFDAFIDGHSHSTVEGKEVTDEEGHPVLLTQTGEYLNAVGKMTISTDGSITSELLTMDELVDITPDAGVKAMEDAWIDEIDTQLGQVIGSIDDVLDNYDSEGNRLVRSQETNTGDFAADALYYLFDNMDMDVDFAIMNGGGIRNKAVTGELTYKTMKAIHTFGNVACLITVTGQQMLDALEWGAKSAGTAENGGFLHVSGLKYTIDTAIPSTVQADEKGVWTGGPTGEYRVKDVQVLNKETGEYEPLDPAASYNLAGYNYTLRDLGDGFAMFNGAVNVLDYVSEDYMVLADYVKSFEGGKVTGYAQPQGRITVIAAEAEDDGVITVGGLDNNLWTTKYGNLYCDCTVEDFFAMGFAPGDLVTMGWLDKEIVLPVVPTYSYVDSGKPAIIATLTDTGAPTGYISFAINMGDFTSTFGIAAKQTDEEGNWWWTANEGVTFPMEITFEMYEQGGYADQILLRELVRTNVRADYPHLTDKEFANFRAVTTTGMGSGTLYRGSSPIDPELGRSEIVDAAIEAAGVKTIVNLADSLEDAAAYEGYATSYYVNQNVKYLSLGVDFHAPDFQAGLAEGLRFMSAVPGPYLIHCTEGKDRAGFTSALLESFMGATYEEVVADYMVTYYNYYGVEPGTEKYTAIAESNIIKALTQAFGVEDLTAADLKAEATEYLTAIGLTGEEIAALSANLSADLVPDDVLMNYSDLDPTAWYAEAVRYVVTAGSMTGTDKGFEPDATVTRATVFHTLWNMEGSPALDAAPSFPDTAGKWYAKSAAWAEATGLTTGVGDGSYAGDRSVTRAEIFTIIYRYVTYKGMDVSVGENTDLLSYTDALDIEEYALPAFQWGCGAGVISGKEGSRLDPNGTAIRTELAQILFNLSNI